MQPDTSDALPLTETTFFILLSLVDGPRHGYAIMKDVEALSDRRITLSTSTLYGALSRLLDQGWIVRVDVDDLGGPGRPRKDYELSEMGRRILAAETNRLQTLLHAAQRRLAEGGA